MPPDETTGTWVTTSKGKPTALVHHRCQIEVVKGASAGTVRIFSTRSFRIGGKRTADLVLDDTRVSGLHFEVSLDSKGYRLRDLDSGNGTFVAGFPVRDLYIHSGTIIKVGQSELRFTVLGDVVALPLSGSDRFGPMVGGSPLMRELFMRLEKIARTDITVLLMGETGTGKDLAAEAIHGESPRRNGPFAILDCASIPANLIESELFGHERGAFTGANERRVGVFERGNGGTVFLDELGELPLEFQPRLLRILENRTVQRVGGSEPIPVDVRIIAATNRDLGLEVSGGRFREDLYYRLAVATVQIPPLRDRKEDLESLCGHILASFSASQKSELGAKTIALLRKYNWPGNIRELRNVLERAALLDEVPDTTQALRMGQPSPPSDAKPASEVDLDVPMKVAKRNLIDEFERQYVEKLLRVHKGNVSAAARAAQVDRMVIHKIAQRFGLRDRD